MVREKMCNIEKKMTTLIIGNGKTGRAIADKLHSLAKREIYTYDKSNIEHDKYSQLERLTNLKLFDNIIITIACGGPDFTKENTWLMRDVELEKNKQSLDEIATTLKVEKYKNKIIMVSNPSDAFAKYFREKYDLNCKAYGISADAKRYSSLLSKQIDVIGYHGVSIPILASENIDDYTYAMDLVETTLAKQVREKGINYEFVAQSFIEYYRNMNEIKKIKKMQSKISLNEIEKKLLARSDEIFLEQYTRLLKF